MDFPALIILFSLAMLPASGRRPPPVDFQQSGIEGRIYLISGNHMPSPRLPRDTSSGTQASPKGTGIKGTICVFTLTSDSQVTRQGTSPWCEAVHTRLIRQVDTDDQGNFSVLLPPGTYSVFTKRGNLFYASRRDDRNNIAPVEVLPGKMTRVNCSVESDHKAVY